MSAIGPMRNVLRHCWVACLALGGLTSCTRYEDVPAGLHVREIEKVPFQRPLTALETNEARREFPDKDLAQAFYYQRVARYELTALVAVKDGFYCCSLRDKTTPIDMTLVWGPFAKTDAIKYFNIRHSGRFFYWNTESVRYQGKDVYEMASNIANTHFVLTSPAIQRQLEDIEPNSVVQFKGFLVNVYSKTDRSYLNSSLTRGDSGAGACEVFEVTELRVLKTL